MNETMIKTMNSIADAMNSQMREWKNSGAIRFDCLPVGSRFVFTTYDDQNPKIKTSHRLYRRDVSGKQRCFTTGSRVLVSPIN